jgi:hypothetical protein
MVVYLGGPRGGLKINFSEVERLVCEGTRDSTMGRVVSAGTYQVLSYKCIERWFTKKFRGPFVKKNYRLMWYR